MQNPEAAFKIINYLIEYEQGWVDSGVTSGLSTSDLYPLYNIYDNANEIEVSYDCLKKYLAGEIGIDDVDYSTHKLLKSDMEAITKLKKSLMMTSVWNIGTLKMKIWQRPICLVWFPLW